MNNENNLKTKIQKHLSKQSLAVLATNCNNTPYTSLVGFITDHDIKEIYFATLNNTTKYKNIENNAAVSLLIDSRTNSVADFLSSSALTVIGKMTNIITEKKDPAFLNYSKKFPNLKDFVNDPLCVLIKIEVSKYIFVEKFQDVQHLDMG